MDAHLQVERIVRRALRHTRSQIFDLSRTAVIVNHRVEILLCSLQFQHIIAPQHRHLFVTFIFFRDLDFHS